MDVDLNSVSVLKGAYVVIRFTYKEKSHHDSTLSKKTDTETES